jgi:hypothetical protein
MTLRDAISASYDIIYLDYEDGVDDIFRNARLLEQAIDIVNARKIGNEPNIVFCDSMGGLVARYALRSMELKGKDHQTRKFISMDSPHKGANVPVGFQAAVRNLRKMKFSIDAKLFFNLFNVASVPVDMTNNAKLDSANALLNKPASKQMLIYYVDDNLNINNSAHEAFMREYERVGMPQRCFNVAASNGSGSGAFQFPAGATLFGLSDDDTQCQPYGWAYAIYNILFLMYEVRYIGIDVYAKALQNKRASTVFRNHIWQERRYLMGLINDDITYTNFELNSTANM